MSIASQYIRGRRKMVPPMTRSGAAFLILTGEVGNPEVTTVYTLSTEPTKETATITTVYELSIS